MGTTASRFPAMEDSSCRALRGVRRVAHLLRLRARPPDEPGPGRPHRRAGRQLGVLDRLPTVPAPDATEDDLVTVHDPGLIEAVMASQRRPDAQADLAFGLGSDDNPTFPNMHQASRHVVGASLEAARQVWTGQVDHAANIAGGLHHAMPDRVSGFCVYNDVAVAIRWLLDNGAERVAYVDVDVHHGDGVESIFYDDPRVLTISLHETGQMLFPGTGFPADAGGPEALGSAVNVALPPGHLRRRLAARLPRRGAAAAARVRARRPGHPAGLRQPPRRPVGPPRAQRRRSAGQLPGPARPGARGRRRPVGGPRRWRLRRRRRGAARVDPPARRRLREPARPSTWRRPRRVAGGASASGSACALPRG